MLKTMMKMTIRNMRPLLATLPLLVASCTEATDDTTAAIGADGTLRRVSVSVGGAGAPASMTATTRAAMAWPHDATATTRAAQLVTGGTVGMSAADERNTAFVAGDQIYLHLDDALVRPGAAYTVAAGTGTMAGQTVAVPLVATEPLVSSNDGATHALYGYYPYVRGSVAVTDNTRSFTVQQDQSGADGYTLSDLMFAQTDVTASGTTPPEPALTFQHQMAKLVLRPYSASDYTDGTDGLRIARVTLVSGYRTVSIVEPSSATPTDRSGASYLSIVGATLSDQISTQQPLTVFSSNDTDGDATNNSISVHKKASDYTDGTDKAGALVCLVPPQTLKQNAPLIRLETSHGDVITYLVGGANSLEGGRAYVLDLPVVPVGSTQVTLEDWTTVDWTYTSFSDAGQGHYSAAGALPFTVGGTTFNMMKVDGGNYTTLRGVSVTGSLSDYYMGETEVTQGLWEAVMGKHATTGSFYSARVVTTDGTGASSGTITPTAAYTIIGDDYPMGGLCLNTVTNATGFIANLNALTEGQRPRGYRFAVPSEAQWEWAARGGRYSQGYTYAGSNTTTEVAWCNANSGQKMHPVARLKPNELGLYDMSGNIIEMCADYATGLSGNAQPGNYTGGLTAGQALGLDWAYTTATSYNVYRGGGYGTGAGTAWGTDNAMQVDKAGAITVADLGTHDRGLRLALVPEVGGRLPDLLPYFSVTAVEASEMKFNIRKKAIALEYSYDRAEWTTVKSTDASASVTSDAIPIAAGQTVYVRSAAGSGFSPVWLGNGTSSYVRILLAGNVRLGGYLMSLAKKWGFVGDGNSISGGTYNFYSLFQRNVDTGVTDDPNATIDASALVMPTNVTNHCFRQMFVSCNLTAAPALPATTLATGCYIRMFASCPTLTASPELPATTLAMSCYGSMFAECTGLTTIRIASPYVEDNFQYSTWLENVPASGTLYYKDASWTSAPTTSDGTGGWTLQTY